MGRRLLYIMSIFLVVFAAGSVSAEELGDYYVIEDFERYSTNAGPDFFKDYWKGRGATGNWYDLDFDYPHGGIKAVEIQYWTYDPPYYCGVGRTETPWVPADWTFGGEAETLSLWFKVYDEILAPTDNVDELYVRLKDSSDREATVQYSDSWPVSNLQTDGYHEWNIALTEFTDENENIDLTNVKTLEMGVGDGFNHPVTIPGEGNIFFDDIRLYPRRCVLKYGQPEADINDDCVVDANDLAFIAEDWLDYDYSITGVPVAPDDPNLVAHWKLDESDPCTVAVDSSGNDHHGTLVGNAAWDPNGKLGGAVYLRQSGSLDYIDCGGGKNEGEPNTWADIEGEITVTAWVHHDIDVWWNTVSYIVGKGRENAWMLKRAWNGSIEKKASFFVDVDGVGPDGAVGQTTIDVTAWHHLAGVYKIYEAGVSSEVMVYVDGFKEGSLACSGSSIGTCNQPVAIGVDMPMTMYPEEWFGHIDDVRIYDRALSHSEILGVIKEAHPGPLAHYEFETEIGGVTPDSSGGHDGTLVNGASIVYDADRDGNVLELDGIDQYVDCGGGHDLNEPNCTDDPCNCTWADILGEFTVTVWVKPDISDGGNGNYRAVVVGKGDDGGYHRDYPSEPNRPHEGWALQRIDWDNVVSFTAMGSGSASFTPVAGVPIGDVNMWDGKWHHVAAVYANVNYIYLYIDGIEVEKWWAKSFNDPNTISTTNYPIWIGANVGEVLGGGAYADGYHGWKGRIDDVRIYDRALTQAEVAGAMAGADVYAPLESLANMYDEEMVNRKIINFKDYQILANEWLADETFPFKE